MNSVADIWSTILNKLKKELSETTISTWFDELQAIELKDNTFYLHCPNDFKKGYIEELFLDNIKAALQDLFSREIQVVLLSTNELQNTNLNPPPRENWSPGTEFTFSTFVVGPSNKLAYAASQSVAENPAKNYNPLFIYGDSGLGKTHLIYAIANAVRKRDSSFRITYAKGDDMTNELVTAIREGRTPEMREKYRQADLLLVDDVQFIAGKQQTQEEFFHTFNTLYESGRQIVLTSDRPPSEMTMLEDRLRTRFEWGLMVDVAPPDFETRMAIVKNKGALLGMEIPDSIASYIAEKVTSNVRQLEGTVNKMLAYKDLLSNPINHELAIRAIQDILKKESEYIPSPAAIISYTCKYYNIEEPIIRGKQRIRSAVQARQIAMYLIRNMTSLSLDDIGKEFNNRDHTTVIHALEKIENQIKKDNAFAETIKELKTNIQDKR